MKHNTSRAFNPARRSLLQLGAGLAAIHAVSPVLAWADSAPKASRKTVILVQLQGGNDGLNTLIPYRQDSYYALRPTLHINKEQQLTLGDELAFHPSLQALMPSWEAGQLALLQNVGYPSPILSHFRSIEIWETASASDQYLKSGWLDPVLPHMANPLPCDAIVLGGALGPLNGTRGRVLALDGNLDQFLKRQHVFNMQYGQQSSGEQQAIVRLQQQVNQGVAWLNKLHDSEQPVKTTFPRHPFGMQANNVARLMGMGAELPVYKLALGSFDTHRGQANTHAQLLKVFAESMSALRTALIDSGHWDNTLVMTFSEFGRRPKENGSGGTDHGTGAPVFVMGGQVKGGVYGDTFDLSQLTDNGNMTYGLDFHSLYQSVVSEVWQLDYALPNKPAPLPFKLLTA